jgi:hypothetical protein
MNARRALTATAIAMVLLTGAGTGRALADDPYGQGLPAHTVSGQCYGDWVLASPQWLDPWPGTDTSIFYGDGSVATALDEWVYFRPWLAWQDASGQWWYRAGNWITANNGYHGDMGSWWVLDGGTWLSQRHGFGVSGNVPTGVQHQGPGTYWLGSEIYWAPFFGSSFAGYYHFEWVGQLTCT